MKKILLALSTMFLTAAALAATVSIPLTVTVINPTSTAAGVVTVAVGATSTTVSIPAVTPPVVVVPPPPPPPVITPPPVLSASCSGNVILNGKSQWTGNFNYGGIIETDGATAPDGSIAVKFTATALPAGGGGYLPICQNPAGSKNVFDTTPYKFVNLTLMATRPGQAWQLVRPDIFSPGGDMAVPGSVSLDIGVSGQVPINTWVTFKYALGACPPAVTPAPAVPCSGGVNLPVGENIWKFGVQDQMYWVAGQNAAATALGAGNVWYAKDIHFSAN